MEKILRETIEELSDEMVTSNETICSLIAKSGTDYRWEIIDIVLMLYVDCDKYRFVSHIQFAAAEEDLIFDAHCCGGEINAIITGMFTRQPGRQWRISEYLLREARLVTEQGSV